MRMILTLAAMAAVARADEGRDDAVRKLETMKLTVDFQDVRLSEAVEYLRQATGLNFVIHPRVLEEEPRIRFKARELSVRSTLKLLLQSKGLTVAYREGALVLLRKDDLEEQRIVEFYDVRSQLAKLQDFPGPRVELATPAPGKSTGPILGIELLVPRDPAVPPEFLVELIRENTGGRSWEGTASIELRNGILVVSQSPGVHREIRALLARLAQYE